LNPFSNETNVVAKNLNTKGYKKYPINKELVNMEFHVALTTKNIFT